MPRAPAPFAPPRKHSTTRQNSLAWALEPLERDPNYVHRRMFGSDAAYLDGLLYLIASDRENPWNGVLVATSQERHAALIDDVPNLLQHPVLGKWLYLPQEDEAFESTAAQLVELALARDPRLGVAPRPKARRRKHWREED